VRECGCSTGGKEVWRGLRSCLNRAGRGGGAAAGELRPSMAMTLIAIKGGRLNRGELMGLKVGSEGRASLRFDCGVLKVGVRLTRGGNGCRPFKEVR
jgi:hypothetical protein